MPHTVYYAIGEDQNGAARVYAYAPYKKQAILAVTEQGEHYRGGRPDITLVYHCKRIKFHQDGTRTETDFKPV